MARVPEMPSSRNMQSTPASANLQLLPGLLVAMLGAVVIAGWHLHVPALLQIHPGFVAMTYNTALAFLLSGLSLVCLQLSWPRLAQFLASGVLLLGGVNLLQTVTGVNLGVDQLLMQQDILVKTTSPGRMAPNTAVCFMLTGVDVWLLASPMHAKIKADINSFLAPAVLALAVIALGGYVLGAETAYGWGNLTRMAAHTSPGFVVIGVALCWQRPSGQPINCLPGVGIALLALVLTLWQALETNEAASSRAKAAQRLAQLKANWSAMNSARQQALRMLATHPDDANGPMRLDLLREAQEYVKNNDFLFVAGHSATGKSDFVAGDKTLARRLAEEAMPGLCADRSAVRPMMDRVDQPSDHVLIMTTPFGGHPHTDSNDCIVAASSLQKTLNSLRSQVTSDRYALTISAGDRTLYHDESDGPWSVETTLQEQGLDLRLRLTPSKAQLASNLLPDVILVAGIALDALLVYALYWMRVAKRREREARGLQQQMQQELALRMKVIENAPYGILLAAQDGRIRLLNRALEQLFGYSSEELVGQPVETLVPVELRAAHAENRHAYHGSSVEPGPMAPNRQIQGHHRDGHVFPVEVTLSPVVLGDQISVIAIVVDVRDRLEAQQRIESQMKELARINDDLNSFAYVASHDLKAPLRGITQLATWIAEDLGDTLGSDAQTHMRLMHSRIARMEMLLEDLLAYSRAGRSDDEIVAVDTGKLVRDIFELAAPEKSIRLQVAADMPVLQTRKVPLELVFRNLINNAIKHHDKAQGVINVSARATAEGVEFAVRDDGPGILPEHQQRVFAMFQTLKPRDEVEGSGIGLALVKKAVESVGGVVTLESDGQQGCTFRFTWPTLHMNDRR